MNARDVLKYGHLTLLGAIEGLPEPVWDAPGACGAWTPRDILAHLASYELVLAEVLTAALAPAPTPCLDRFLALGERFNDDEVAARRHLTAPGIVAEYTGAAERVAELAGRIAPDAFAQPGTLPWYGAEYALDDLIVYLNYGHKREHAAQIAAARDRSLA